jgi:hypothetical protein
MLDTSLRFSETALGKEGVFCNQHFCFAADCKEKCRRNAIRLEKMMEAAQKE